jgi:hypothetical protein
VLLVASSSAGDLGPAEWRGLAQAYEARSTISRETMENLVADLVWPAPDLSGVPPLTDDFAPIETMRF